MGLFANRGVIWLRMRVNRKDEALPEFGSPDFKGDVQVIH